MTVLIVHTVEFEARVIVFPVLSTDDSGLFKPFEAIVHQTLKRADQFIFPPIVILVAILLPKAISFGSHGVLEP